MCCYDCLKKALENHSQGFTYLAKQALLPAELHFQPLNLVIFCLSNIISASPTKSVAITDRMLAYFHTDFKK